jgi:hypothetical protein
MLLNNELSIVLVTDRVLFTVVELPREIMEQVDKLEKV